ncbi:MAG: aminotransferase class III-fold pyridoxal phosphate-dependent enzyme, partial [Actinomycetota bacterium]|nr:aminotransferase class III-fold pyridoxal phosphate-dependent enzyme [Actinomycetota bacterium]
YLPLGGLVFRRRIGDAMRANPTAMFLHGATWGGHPVACAVALANLGVFDTEDLLGNVQRNGEWLGGQLRELMARHEIVGDVRGTGYFWALELVADREHKVAFDDAHAERLLRGFLSPRLLELGLICRADDRDEPVIQISPPLIADRLILGELVDILDQVLGEAQKEMAGLRVDTGDRAPGGPVEGVAL